MIWNERLNDNFLNASEYENNETRQQGFSSNGIIDSKLFNTCFRTSSLISDVLLRFSNADILSYLSIKDKLKLSITKKSQIDEDVNSLSYLNSNYQLVYNVSNAQTVTVPFDTGKYLFRVKIDKSKYSHHRLLSSWAYYGDFTGILNASLSEQEIYLYYNRIRDNDTLYEVNLYLKLEEVDGDSTKRTIKLIDTFGSPFLVGYGEIYIRKVSD